MRFLLILTFMLLPVGIDAFCILGEDGNYHSNEDPFVDAANHDFRLKPGACAVDRGATIASVKDDILGTPRPQGTAFDIGAYELIQRPPLKTPEEFKVE